MSYHLEEDPVRNCSHHSSGAWQDIFKAKTTGRSLNEQQKNLLEQCQTSEMLDFTAVSPIRAGGNSATKIQFLTMHGGTQES